jgi:hypothetical protein
MDSEKTTLSRFAEKLIRQRKYYVRLARKWRDELTLIHDPAARALTQGKIDTIEHCAQDLEFALNQVKKAVAPEFWADIESLAQKNEEWILKKIHDKINNEQGGVLSECK